MKNLLSSLVRPKTVMPPVTEFSFHVPDGNHETRAINLLRNQSIYNTQNLFQQTPHAENPILAHYIHEFFLTNSDAQLHKALGNRIGNQLLDFSTEAITFFPLDNLFSKKLMALHDYLEKNAHQNVLLLNANSVSNLYYENWCRLTNKKPMINIIGYDFYLLESILALSKKFHEKNYFSSILDDAIKTVSKNELRSKRFSSLNNKFKAHRYAVAVHLADINMLDETDISFFPPKNIHETSVEDAHSFLEQLNNGKSLLVASQHFNQQLPLIFDRDKTTLENDVYKLADEPDVWEALLGISPTTNKTFLNNSYIDIVTETWFTDASCQFITEKTLRPLITLKPFLHVGTPYILHKLKTLGFQTFSPLINETYDLISDPAARMDMILQEISRLAALTIQQLHELYCELWPRMVHNYFHALRDSQDWFKPLLLNLSTSINDASRRILTK